MSSFFMLKVLPSIVPTVRPAPFHCMLNFEPSCVYVALTSRVTSVPDGGTMAILLLHVPSALMLNVPERTCSSAFS